MDKECLKCGGCCKYIIVTPASPHEEHIEWLKNHNIDLEVSPIGTPWKALKINIQCKNLTEDNLCLIYANRPKACRDFEVGGIKECPLNKEVKDEV